MKILLGLFLTFAIVICAEAQNKHHTPKKLAQNQNTILAAVLSNLTTDKICGSSGAAEKEVYSGSIIKRQFGKSEMSLEGFVLKMANDKRVYINLDAEYIDGRAASASEAISDFLTKGRRIQVFAYRCRRILYAYKIKEI